jgi:hypothetical protein
MADVPIMALVGMSLIAGAGVAYVAMHEFVPQKQVSVVPRNPPVQSETVRVQPEPTSSRGNPSVLSPVPFGPVPNVTVNAIPAPAPAPVVQTAPVKKKKVAKKKRAPTTNKLQTQWGLPPAAKPFSFGDLFNVN